MIYVWHLWCSTKVTKYTCHYTMYVYVIHMYYCIYLVLKVGNHFLPKRKLNHRTRTFDAARYKNQNIESGTEGSKCKNSVFFCNVNSFSIILMKWYYFIEKLTILFLDLCMDFFCNSNFGWNQYFLYRTRISNLAGRKRTLWYGWSINRCFRKRSVGICRRGLVISLSISNLYFWSEAEFF